MCQDRIKYIEYLKRAIKRNYKRYTGERTDGQATLMDVLRLFNISIDESRIDDYLIESIDYNVPSIKVIDKKTNTTYTSEYTDKAKLLNYSGNTSFVNVIISNPNCKLESLYYIGTEELIIAQMTFTDGDYELIFEKETGNSIESGLDADSKFVVRYVKNVPVKDKQGKQQLLSKIFMIKNNNETLEQTYTYSTQHFIKYDDDQDKYCYTQNGNIIYGVNNCRIRELIHYMHGICFESINVDVNRYLPYDIKTKDFPELANNKMYQSGIVFRGGTSNEIHHTFTIFKTKNQVDNKMESKENKVKSVEKVYLKYEAIKWEKFGQENGMPKYKKMVVASKEAIYPRIDIGNITSREIRNITEVLDTEFEDDIFIQFVINELKVFANKMDIEKGILEEELEPLSPKVLINKTFDEIYTLVNSNKNDYFNLISEQFISATNIKNKKDFTLILEFKKDDNNMSRLAEIMKKDFEKDE